ncbi:MAG: single-stranded DNA-binding protein [Ardenticatenales bacterium]|nr:single-stranded DNA-binding protein [Ardenticatenales bacterium]
MWYRVSPWGDLGEQYARALRKGDFVKVRGRYHEEPWTDEQGQTRQTRKVTTTVVRQLRARMVVREPEPTYVAWLQEKEISLPLPGQRPSGSTPYGALLFGVRQGTWRNARPLEP